MSNIQEFMCAINRGLPELKFGDEVEPERADLTGFADNLEQVEQREEITEALSHVQVSEKTRAQCVLEMHAGERRGWQC